MLISQICFGGASSPELIEQKRKLDRRCSDYYAIYALDEAGTAVSQVEVLHIDTRTREGKERVAGIAGVATLPGHSRRGLSTSLMRRAHDLTRERGMRISTLLTSASLVAHEMYVKLGYVTLTTFPRGCKRLAKGAKKTRGLRFRKFSAKDSPKLNEVFTAQTKDALGFVYRQDDFVEMMAKTKQIRSEHIKVAVTHSKVVGYALTDPLRDCVTIFEIVGADESIRSDAIDAIESAPDAKWALCHSVSDSRIYQLYENKGYRMYKPGWGRAMAACVDGSLTINEIVKLYGADEGRFIIYAMDSF